MSDQDTPPPFDENSPSQDATPPAQEPAQDGPPPIAPTGPAVGAGMTSPPPTGAIGLGQGKLSQSDERTMGMLAHILGGVTNFLGPLIIWLIKKDESPFVDDQGKEALNFQITIAIGYVVMMVLSFVPLVGCIASLLMMGLWVVGLIFGVLGGLEANKGNVYRYPFALRLIN